MSGMLSRTSGIYRIVHIESGRCYIGSSVNIAGRWYAHRRELRLGTHHSKFLQRAWMKYGESCFAFEIIERVEDHADLLPREQFYLDTMKPAFNTAIFAGASQRGRPVSLTTRLKMKAVLTGRSFSLETLERMRVAAKERANRPEEIERLRTRRRGTTATAETRKKQSDVRRGKKLTAETKANMSAALMRAHELDPTLRAKTAAFHVGRKRSSETRRKMSEATAKSMADPAARSRISETLNGHPVSAETRRKISESLRGNKNRLGGKKAVKT